MKKIVFLIISIFPIISCYCQHKEGCVIPQAVENYIKNNLPNSRVIGINDLIYDWQDFIYPEIEINCPTMLDCDFTNDGYKDFICMLVMCNEMPYLVAFNNYETNEINHQIIDGIAYYGKEYGYGNIIYLANNAKGFYNKKIESSTVLVLWKNNKYTIEYEDD